MSGAVLIKAATMCSGIGAPELAAPEFDWVAMSDIEPFSHALFGQRWPHVERHGDLTQIDLQSSRYMDAEILVAGTPCQAFSHAGNRKGLDDPRGQITLKFVEAVHELAATGSLRAVLWENVPGVLSDDNNAFGCFLGALVGIGYPAVPSRRPRNGVPNQLWRRIGRKRRRRNGKRQYRKPKLVPAWPSVGMVAGPRARIAWRILDAQHWGVPQRRRRVFLVFSPGASGPDPAAILFEPKGLRRDPATGGEAGQDVAGSLTSGSGGCDENDAANGRLIAHTLRGEGFDASEDGTGRGTPLVPVAMNLRGRDGGAMPELDDKASLRASSGGSSRSYVAFVQNQRDEVRLMGGDGSGDGTVAARHGAKEQTYIAFSSKDNGQDAGLISPTLRSGNFDKSHANAGVPPAIAFNTRQDPISSGIEMPLDTDGTTIGVSTGYAVRRLLPIETERLQGMPDNHTLIEFNGGPAADGRRYAGVGNSMAVPVVRWILMRAARIMLMQRRAA